MTRATKPSANPTPPKVLRAQRIELVDSEGNVRCRIGPRQSRRSDETTVHTFDFDLFGTDGKIVAKIAANIEAGTAEVTLGDHEHGCATMHTKTLDGQYGKALRRGAEIELYGGYGGVGSSTEWHAVASQGGTPGTWTRDLELDWTSTKPPFIAATNTLEWIVKDARRKAKKLRDQATEKRLNGDKSKALSFNRMALKLERLIEQTQREFDERQAVASKAWDEYWKGKSTAEAKDSVTK